MTFHRTQWAESSVINEILLFPFTLNAKNIRNFSQLMIQKINNYSFLLHFTYYMIKISQTATYQGNNIETLLKIRPIGLDEKSLFIMNFI